MRLKLFLVFISIVSLSYYGYETAFIHVKKNEQQSVQKEQGTVQSSFDIAADKNRTLWHLKNASTEKQDTQAIDIDLDLLKPDHTNGDRLQVSLSGKRVDIIRTRSVSRADNNFTWHGKVKDKQNSTVVLTVVDDMLYGVIKVNRETYNISKTKTGHYQLLKLQGRPVKLQDDVIIHKYASHPENSQSSESTNQTLNAASAQSSSSLPTIDVLMLYTADMASEHGSGITAYFQNMLDITNNAYENSGAMGRLNLLSIQQLPQELEQLLSENITIHSALNTLSNNANVQHLRNDIGADLVTLARVYKGQGGCGLAGFGYITDATGSKTLLSEHGFSVIETGRWHISEFQYLFCPDTTFAHETGHNLGLTHDRNHANGDGLFSYSYGYDVPNEFATIMSYDEPSINYFSTPLKTHNGIPIGIAEGSSQSADNVRTMNQTFSMVNNFRTARVNTPPTAANNQISLNEDEELVFSRNDFGYQDADGDEFNSIKIVALETSGILTLDNIDITLNQIVHIQDIDSGLLSYRVPGTNTSTVDNFRFLVNDGLSNSTNQYTMTIDILLDSDSDGIADHLDNCPFIPNPDQQDTNQDGLGDLCDRHNKAMPIIIDYLLDDD